MLATARLVMEQHRVTAVRWRFSIDQDLGRVWELVLCNAILRVTKQQQ